MGHYSVGWGAMREVLPAPVILHDPDLLVGGAVELVDDLVDQSVGLLDPRQQWSERCHRVRELPAQAVLDLLAQVVLEPGAAWGRRPAFACYFLG